MSDPALGIGFDRRVFLKAAAVATGAASWSGIAATSEPPPLPSVKRIDVNVNLSHWPCRRVPNDDTVGLVTRLRRGGVTQAWAGSFDGLLHKNIAAVNARLAEECRERGDGLLVPFGTVNPMLPDWEEDLRRCVEEHKMPGIRLHPNYHGYRFNDPIVARLLELASQRRLIVQVALYMEDERMMHPLLRVPTVDPAPLGDLVKQMRGLRLVLLNVKTPRIELFAAQSGEAEVYMDTALIEGVAGVERLLEKMPLSRLCFGSNAPLFYFEAALLKLKESVLSDEQLSAVRSQNAERLLSSNG